MRKDKIGKKGYEKYKSKASEYLKDNDKAKKLLYDARNKANKKKGLLGDVWEKIQLLFSVFDDWIRGRYKVLPGRSIAMIIVAISYFVIPMDLVPDFLLGLGYGDDIAVIAFVLNQVNKDLSDYKEWKDTNKLDKGEKEQ